jgi:hypothetical protein
MGAGKEGTRGVVRQGSAYELIPPSPQ